MAEDNDIDLSTLLAPLVEHWRSMLAVPLLVGCLALAGSYLIKPTFVATTIALPPQQAQGSALAALSSLGALAGLSGGAGPKNLADQYVGLLQSVTISDRIIDRFDLVKVYDTDYRMEAREELQSRVDIKVGKKDGLLTIDVEDTDPKRAAAMANQYIAELGHMTAHLAVTEAQQRRLFFDKQLKDTRSRLAQAQTVLQRSGINPGALKAEPKAAAENYARLKAEMTAAQVRLQTMRQSLADGSTEVQQQLTLVQALRSQLQQIESTSRTADTDASNADYISAYREFKYQETLFDLLAQQYEMARVDESRDGAVIQVVDVAQPPELKSKPKRALIAVAGTLVGGVVYGLWLIGGAWRRREQEAL